MDHASGGVGGFAGRLALLDDDHGYAVLSQTPGERESNHASADDHDVPGLHRLIVVESFAAADLRRIIFFFFFFFFFFKIQN